jgi:3-oxosteroid 1-dehydrogenase
MVVAHPDTFDETFDVVVVGSGGAALTAAFTAVDGGAQVLVVEKAEVLGGTTGVSGGGVWVPNNRHLADQGLEDSREDALAYITHIADGRALDPSLVEVFVDTVNEAVEYLEAKTPLETQPVPALVDYYGAIIERTPGCKPYSRTIEPLPFAAREQLGDEWADRVAARSTLLSLGASTTLREDMDAMFGGGMKTGLDELAERERAGVRVKGGALIGCLLKAILDAGADVRVSTPADELVVDGDGAVIGVRVAGDRPGSIGARKGVILACGGFEWNLDMVLAYLGYDVKPLSPGGNTGDGHLMAMEAGAKMGNMTQYWGQGAMFDPNITLDDGTPAPQMMTGLGPGSIIVNGRGERFMSGGLTYNDFPKPFGSFDQNLPGYPNTPPAFVVFGPTVKSRGPILTMRPDDPAPDWLVQAPSIGDLAGKIGVDSAALEASIERFNANAADGADPDFGERDVAPVDGPPYYAIEQWPASLGTNGGCRINADGQVLGNRREVIAGLYAAGNTAATVLGGAYLGGGTPIASGITFGYLAGGHAAAATPRTERS